MFLNRLNLTIKTLRTILAIEKPAGKWFPNTATVSILLGLVLINTPSFADGSPVAQAVDPETMLTLTTEGGKLDGKLLLKGIPFTHYSRGVLKFAVVPPDGWQKSEKVERATLSFDVDVLQTPSEPMELEILPISIPWSEEISLSTPDGLAKWPGVWPNIDNATHSLGTPIKVSIPSQPGTTRFNIDITQLTDQWIFSGLANQGLLLRIGKSVYGKPDLGTWDVVVQSPKLEIKMTPGAPTVDDFDSRAIRHFPSALLPPIRDPYVFLVFNQGPLDHNESVINTVGLGFRSASQGFLPLNWFFGPNNPYADTEEQFVSAYVSEAKTHLGIHVDEWQGKKRVGEDVAEDADPVRLSNEAKVDYSIKGIIEAKKANPHHYVAVYWRGEDSIEPLTKIGYPDLLVVQAQEYLDKMFPLSFGIDQAAVLKRIAYAEELGALERTIPLIGFFIDESDYHPGKVLNETKVKSWIARYRKEYPEMPGLAFYGGKGGDDLLLAAEKLAREYYIAPAPSVRIESPAFEGVVTVPRLPVSAVAEGKDGREIIRYDWYINNSLMAQTKVSEWVLDTRLLKPGRHIVTVHAIDSAYNRAAAQTPFLLEAPPTDQ